MKKTRKIFAVVLALVMCFAMALPAMAATVTVKGDNPGHMYKIYQIFTGTLSINEKGEEVLSDIKYGKNYVPEGAKVDDKVPTEELKDIKEMGGEAYAETFYDGTRTLTGDPFETIDNNGTKSLVDGYYLVVDTAKEDASDENFVYSTYIIQVLGSEEIDPKDADIPQREKKVIDVNDSTGGEGELQDSADYDIGDDVPFQLKATLPSNVTSYKTYKLIFHDKEAPGLSFNNDVEVKVGGIKVENRKGEDGNDLYTVVTPGKDDDCTFEVIIPNVEAIGATNGSEITVEYTAKLTEGAVVGANGNENTMHLEYSNNPTVGGEGDTGTTENDTVIVFTYQLDISKVRPPQDGEDGNQPLSGAAFKLEKYIGGKWVQIKEIQAGTDTAKFTFKGLDDGQYRLTETATPTGYNSIDPIYFEITADHEVHSDSPTLKDLDATQKAAGKDEVITGNLDEGTIPTFEATCTPAEGTIVSDIVNQAGTTLPETGGIGTTIFYVVGICLVVVAGVILVTRKRVGKNN